MIIAFLVIASIAVGVVFIHDFRKPPVPDPIYQNKPVSLWVNNYMAKTEDSLTVLQKIGEPAVPYLIPNLSRKDSIFNTAWVKIWTYLPGILQSRTPAPMLAREVRWRALSCLRDMKPTPPSAVGPLMDCFHDGELTFRLHAVIALGNVGPDARAAVPLIKPFLTSNHTLRVYAANALWKIEHKAEEILPVLEQGVQEDAPFRWVTAVFLGRMGPAAERAIPFLEEATRAADKGTASCAVQALAQISPRTLPILIAILRDPDPRMRISAAVALGSLGALAKDAVPSLTSLLGDNERAEPRIAGRSSGMQSVSQAAAEALKLIDPDAGGKAGVE